MIQYLINLCDVQLYNDFVFNVWNYFLYFSEKNAKKKKLRNYILFTGIQNIIFNKTKVVLNNIAHITIVYYTQLKGIYISTSRYAFCFVFKTS